jgi:putative SOS response-associated peptidase YedK
VRTLPTFRDAYRQRRCIVLVDGFFEWKAIKGQKARQPYAIAMKDGMPFGIEGAAAAKLRLDPSPRNEKDAVGDVLALNAKRVLDDLGGAIAVVAVNTIGHACTPRL